MMEATRIMTHDLEAAANSLADWILESPAFTQAKEAREQLERDTAAMQLLNLLRQSQTMLRWKQARNEVTQTDVDQLRRLQQQLGANRSISEYARTQQETVILLRSVNQELTELVGMDLSSLLPQACSVGGC